MGATGCGGGRVSIVVVGDVLLDVDQSGSAERLSPDAPVPVVEVAETRVRAGGAGLVATMLAGDGHDVRLVTALGDDARAGEVRDALHGVAVVACASGAATPVKTRLRSAGHAIARIDEGCAPAPAPVVDDAMLEALDDADAVVVADYGRGLTADLRLRARLEQAATRVPVVWDPHPRGSRPTTGAAVATPNLDEARRASGVTGCDIPAASEAGRRLARRWACPVAVTLGPRGALLVGFEGGVDRLPLVVPAPPVTVDDPCGAGDRLAASIVEELAAGSSLGDALRSGVVGAARFLAAGGVSADPPVAPAPAILHGEGAAAALELAQQVRSRGGTVVATGGCFDLLHAGHARTLQAARSLGDCLIVCLNSDRSVRRLKGPERPIIEQSDRSSLLLALEYVDAVVVFDEDTPESVLRRLRPDVWVKGGDYEASELPEAGALAEWGGTAVTVPFSPARSTSSLARALAQVS